VRRNHNTGYPIGNRSQPRRIILGSGSRYVKLWAASFCWPQQVSNSALQQVSFLVRFPPVYAGSALLCEPHFRAKLRPSR
jgi:hypothetical protein